jgi:ribosomal protein S27AE
MLFSILWSLVPFVIIVVVLWPLVRMIRKNQRRSEEYMVATTRHHEKVERLLERIALGLSSNGQSRSLPEQATCVECGGIFKVTDMIKHEDRFVCARCKPILLQKLSEGAKLGSGKT